MDFEVDDATAAGGEHARRAARGSAVGSDEAHGGRRATAAGEEHRGANDDESHGSRDSEKAGADARPPGSRVALDRGESAPLEAGRHDRRRRGLLEQARERGQPADLVTALDARGEMVLEDFGVVGSEDAEHIGPEVGVRLGVLRHQGRAPRGRA